jgi:signal transduction histidine kinase
MKTKLCYIIILLLCFNIVFAQELNTLNNTLTSTQKNYLIHKKVIRMCNNPNWAPIEFANNDNLNDMQGIAIDNIKLLEKKLNIKFINVPTKSWEQSQEFLKAKKCDILPSAVKTSKREKYANFTKPYLNLPLAIFTTKDKKVVSGLDEIMDKTWTRQKGSGLITKLKKEYPNMKIIETKGDKEALQYVNSDKAYFTIATLPVASHVISKFLLNNLHIAGYTNMVYNLSIAVRDDDKILLSILNKSLNEISNKESKNIFKKWVNASVKEPITDYSMFWKIFGVVFIIILALINRQSVLKRMNNTLQEKVDAKTKKLQELNTDLEQRIKIAIKENEKKSYVLSQQSKMAAMGEMLENIAHQWRQPLTIISTAASGMKIQKELNVLTHEHFIYSVNNIVKNTKHLSQTIDTFRDFFKSNKGLKLFNIKEAFEKTEKLITSKYENSNIEIINELKDVETYGLESELIQVFMIILNNAKEAFEHIEDDEAKKYIFVTVYNKKNFVYIKIKDTANGISPDIIDRIFEPYFTTKNKSQGTGIGLYMTEEIIEKHMKGTITVCNQEFDYKNHHYRGAEFKIKLPFNTTKD